MRPLVSILMPCYNAEKFLRYSLESILNQDYNNLEIICIDDGSTDGTYDLLKDYSSADTRIVIIKNEKNVGLISSLNHALTFVNGEFFARMDADDYCLPERITKQVHYLTNNPQFDLVATGYHYFIHDNKKLEYVPPIATLPGALKFISLFSTPLNHASSLGRRELITSGIFKYDKDYPHSEDYELFSRLAWQGIQMANISDPLYWVRLNPESVSVIYNDVQIRSHLKITKRNLLNLKKTGLDLSDSFLKIITNRINCKVSAKELATALHFLNDCLQHFIRENTVTELELREIKSYFRLHWLNILIQSNKTGFIYNRGAHVPFLMRSLSFVKSSHLGHIFYKAYNFLRYRLF